MMLTTIVELIVAAILLLVVFCLSATFLYMLKNREKNRLESLPFEDLMTVLSLIINTELAEYDNELLIGDRPITNQNFDTFYADITRKILDNVSDELMDALALYTTRDNVIRIIARRTKAYLRDKIGLPVQVEPET